MFSSRLELVADHPEAKKKHAHVVFRAGGIVFALPRGGASDRARPRGHRGVRVRHLLGILALHGAHQTAARARHLAKDGELLIREALHRLHEVRDQVGAALVLVLDLRPLGVDGLAEADEVVLVLLQGVLR